MDLVDELDCLAQIELCRILDPIPPPSDLLPVVSKIIAKILKFYNKEKVPGFNNKLKILAYLETIPLRPAEIDLSVALCVSSLLNWLLCNVAVGCLLRGRCLVLHE